MIVPISKSVQLANNANRKRYRRKKSPKLQRFRTFSLRFFAVEFYRYPKPKTAFGEDLN